MGWNDALSAGLDWSALAFAGQYRNAINERRAAVGLGTYASLAVGDDVQAASFWNTIQSDLESICTSYVRNPLLISGAPYYDTSNYPTPGPTFSPAYTEPADFAYTLTLLRSDAGLNANGFTRKYPYEFASNASAAYTDGNAFVDGDRARRLSDGLVCDRSGGAWVPTSNPLGDVPTTRTAYGLMQAGDYIGLWIFTELRAVINLLWKRAVSVTVSGGTSYQKGHDGTTSYADSKAWVEAAWPTAAVGPANKLTAISTLAYDGFGEYEAAWQRFSRDITFSSPAVTAVSQNWQLYAVGLRNSPLISSPSTSAYSAQGTSFGAENTWTAIGSGSGTSGTVTEGGGANTLTWPGGPTPRFGARDTNVLGFYMPVNGVDSIYGTGAIAVFEYLFTERAGV